MSTPARRRLMKDLSRISNSEEKLFAGPTENNIMQWVCVITGPVDTPFEGGCYILTMEFAENYPQNPPNVKFVTEIFHPNVYLNGELCLDLLRNKWSPTYDVLGVLISVQSLLNDPNTASPANCEAADMYNDNYEEYATRNKALADKSKRDLLCFKKEMDDVETK